MMTQNTKSNKPGLYGYFPKKNLNVILFATGLALCNASANAATLYGATVDFSFDDIFLNSLFGSYSISGDTLSFFPTNFVAQANNNLFGTANATTPLITVSAKSGYVLSGVSLFEQGDYYRIETAPNTSFVSVGGQFIVNNNATNFSADQPLNAKFDFNDLANGTPFVTSSWTVSEDVALNAAESATVKVQNVLIAGALPNVSTAFIEKKLLSIGAATFPVAVPVPAAFWTFGSALLGLLSVGRRKLAA